MRKGGEKPNNQATDDAISGHESISSDIDALRQQDAAEREERVPLARMATVIEKDMSFVRCVKAFWPAVLQAIILSCACIMEGFDLVLITGFLTNPVFRRKYQCPDAPIDNVCEIPASWQSALVIGPTVGQMIGVLLSGWLVERFGYKKTFMASLVALSGFIFIVYFATSLAMFLVGLLLCGLPWGVFQTLTTNYASDVCPTPIRAYVTAWSNVCWIIGQCLGAVTQRALVSNTTMLSIRIPLGLQWVFPVPIFIFSLWAQESPWWLVRKGNNEGARKALSKLVAHKHAPEGYTVDNHLAMIQLTNADELRETNGTGTGYLDCFKGVNRRRTEISTITWVIQNASGSALMQWSPYFFQRAGMPATQAWNFVIVQASLLIYPQHSSHTNTATVRPRPRRHSRILVPPRPIRAPHHRALGSRTPRPRPQHLRHRCRPRAPRHALWLDRGVSAAPVHACVRLHNRSGHIRAGV
jgi:SP family general alpha glucoside:H+ symporter-like MFS transporter